MAETKKKAEGPLMAADAAPAEPPAKPDAILAPQSFALRGADSRERTAYAADYARPIIGSPVSGRSVGGGLVLLTNSPFATLNTPDWYDQPRTPRYRWVDQGNRVSFGYLIEGVPTDADLEEKAKEQSGV